MRGDGAHPPEALPQLLAASIEGGHRFVLGSRLADRRGAVRSGMSFARLAAHALATGVLNRVLGLRVRDYLTSFRVLHTRPLRRIPFHLDADDRIFDPHLLLQLRSLGVTPHEVAVAGTWREDDAARQELDHARRAATVAVVYRLHQIHVVRRGRYLVDTGVDYTFKWSEHGSHMQIVDLIRPETRVLDLGCSQGLLARPLTEKGVRVVGVDGRPAGEDLAEELEDYLQRDLELPLEIPKGRDFDYVVCADVIEHLKGRAQLLRSARRYLKADGRLIISTGNVAILVLPPLLLAGRFNYGPRGILDQDHADLYTRDSFRREVVAAGFRAHRRARDLAPLRARVRVHREEPLRAGCSLRLPRVRAALARLFAYQIDPRGADHHLRRGRDAPVEARRRRRADGNAAAAFAVSTAWHCVGAAMLRGERFSARRCSPRSSRVGTISFAGVAGHAAVRHVGRSPREPLPAAAVRAAKIRSDLGLRQLHRDPARPVHGRSGTPRALRPSHHGPQRLAQLPRALRASASSITPSRDPSR